MIGTERNQAVTLEKKEEMVRKAAFSYTPADSVGPPTTPQEQDLQKGQ